MMCDPGFRWDPTLNACVPIAGAESEPEPDEAPEDQDDEEPTDAQVKRMTKPELVGYGAALGLDLDEEEHSHEEMVKAVLAKRGSE